MNDQAHTASVPNFEASNLSVLLVDRNRYLASILRHILSVGGIRDVHHTVDAIGGLETLKAAPISIGLLDDDLSGITALELASLIRTAPDSPNPNLPLILLSGHPTKRDVDDAKNAGINYFVKKPLSATVLLQRVSFALRQAYGEIPVNKSAVKFG